MPTPGSLHAPLFKGERVTDFLDSLEVFANSAQVDLNNLPVYVLCYCNCCIRYVIESASIWSQHDWAATRAYLIKLYGSNDKKQHTTPDKFCKWTKKQSGKKAFTHLQDVDHYYHEFTARALSLVTSNQLTENDANILFFRGIPKAQQKTIRCKLLADKTKIQSPPARDNILVLLQKEFDEDNIANDKYDTDSSTGSSEETDSSNLDDSDLDEDDPPPKAT
ncbi:hypothetical protein L208DRAFT_1267694 [Tricholoma matsutake]|nr:hypothetical protein L208DRAFT_1267694 [Tricholoma matsutake 945]